MTDVVMYLIRVGVCNGGDGGGGGWRVGSV